MSKDDEVATKIAVKRLDHLGIVAGTIKDCGIIEIINEYLGVNNQEGISSGEAVAGLIMNGLGFISKPLMLVPEFFENKPLDLLICEAATAEQFNRHKLGRVLDDIEEFGCEKLFEAIAFKVCEKEKINSKFVHGDTTSISLAGEYDVEDDTERVLITHGYSKDKRPDLKQLVVELLVAEDGGIPLMMKVWSGNESDNTILRERAESLLESFALSESYCFVADSKVYTQKSAHALKNMRFITRVPGSLKAENEAITHALAHENTWQNGKHCVEEAGEEKVAYKFQEISSTCYGISSQRWIIVYSLAAHDRAQIALKKQIAKDKEIQQKIVKQLQKTSFACQDDAQKAIAKIAKKMHYHSLTNVNIIPAKQFLQKGRPTQDTPYELSYQVTATLEENNAIISQELNYRSCFVIATTVPASELSPEEVLNQYKDQDKVEKGFSFLKSPSWFVSSLFLKKPGRIKALLMVMILALLVYSVAQIKLRKRLKQEKRTIKNQIDKPTQNPTMRRIFELFNGVDIVTTTINNITTTFIAGINDLRRNILSLFSPAIKKIYLSSYQTG